MTIDELCAAVEDRQVRTSPALRKMCGCHVTPMTFAEAQADYAQGLTGCGCDYDGIKQSPDADFFPSASTWREANREKRQAYMKAYWAKKRGGVCATH